MIWWQIGAIVVFSLGLMQATGWLVGAVERLSWKTHWDKFGLAAFLVATATSLPELLVGVSAALEGRSALPLGNVLGSNIANVSLVVGGAAVIGGSIGVVGEFIKRDFFTAFLAGSLPLLMLVDGQLSRVEGGVLVVVYALYNFMTLGERRSYARRSRGPVFFRLVRRLRDWDTDKEVGWIVVSGMVMVVMAQLLVKTAVAMAEVASLSVFIVGLLVVSVGTVLPELAFEIEAIRKREAGMVLGNLLGTIVTNATLILGVVSLIAPVTLVSGINPYLVATVAFVVVFGVFWLLVRTKKRLDRWEGVVLVLVYLVFAYWELVH